MFFSDHSVYGAKIVHKSEVNSKQTTTLYIMYNSLYKATLHSNV